VPAHQGSPERTPNSLASVCGNQGDHAPLFPGQKLTKDKFTYQISDHLPLWIQLNTDTEGEKLDQIVNPRHKP